MVSSVATTVAAYLASLPEDRRTAIARVREIVNANLPVGFEEGMQYGMMCWYVPLSRYPDTYNGQALGLVALGSQKNYMALYLSSVYGDPALEKWFRAAFANAGKKLDMGKSCVRFKSLDALPLDVIGETIGKVPLETFIERYEAVRAKTAKPSSARAVRAAAEEPKPKATPKQPKPKAKPAKRRRA
jgi:hypothetical protein